MKKRTLALLLCLVMAASFAGCSKKTTGGVYTPGTYEGSGQGYGGTVTVSITVDANSITDVKVTGDQETPTIGGAALEDLGKQIKEKGADMDGVSGATLTSNGAKEGAAAAIAKAKGESAQGGALRVTAGTYTGTVMGYNADGSKWGTYF